MEMIETFADYEKQRGKPVPSANHAVIQSSLSAALMRYAEDYSILAELSLELDGRPFVPDLSIYPRLKLDPLRDETKKIDPPLTVIEILSPTQTLDDLIRKANAYLETGVKSCWIVQPALETIAVLVPDQKPQTFVSGEVQDPATGISVQLADVFRPFH